MYHVTCPSCGHVERSGFARVGAVLVCPSCKAKAQLRVEDVKRQFRIRTDVDEELFRFPPSPPAPPASSAPPAPHASLASSASSSPTLSASQVPMHAAAANEIGLDEPANEIAAALEEATAEQALPFELETDHSHDHESLAEHADLAAEARAKRRPRPGAAAAPATREPGGAAALAQSLAKRRHQNTAVMLVGAAVLLVVGIFAIIKIMGGDGADPNTIASKDLERDGGATDSAKDGTSPVTDGHPKDAAPKDGAASKDSPLKDGPAVKDGAPVRDGKEPVKPDPTKDKNPLPVPPPPVARVDAAPFGVDAWQPVNEPFRMIEPTARVALVNESRETTSTGEHAIKAEVASQGVIPSALVSVSLVNDEDRVVARFERPIVLLDGKKNRPVNVVIPRDLMSASLTVHSSVVPLDTQIKRIAMLDDALATVQEPGKSPVLKLAAINTSDFVLRDCVFVIQAVDAGGHVLRQWRLKYPNPVGAKQWVRFETQLVGELAAMPAEWRTLAAGIPDGEAVVQPPPDPVKPDPGERDPKPLPPRRRPGIFDF